MTARQPEATVVIVCKEDPGLLDTLDALRVVDGIDDVQIVVVDASGGKLRHIQGQFPNVEWFDYVHEGDKVRTIAEQRNFGVARANGATIVFLDASCRPTRDWLEALLRPIRASQEFIVTGAIQDSGASPIHTELEPRGRSDGDHLSEFWNLNVAISRDVFDRVGPFDEALGFAEDVDFAWRAVDAGYDIRFAAGALVSHDWGSLTKELSRALRYGVGRVRLYRKHPSRVREGVRRDAYMFAYAVFLVFLPVALFFPAYLLVLAIPLARNRRSHPIATVTYQLAFGVGLLSELLHVPVLKSQRQSSRTH